MKKQITLLMLVLLAYTGYAQEKTGINTTSPKATLDVVGNPTDANSLDGVISPRLTGDQLKAKNYTADQKGAAVYVTAAASTANQTGQTVNVKEEGQYVFDGTVWTKFTDTNDSEWKDGTNSSGGNFIYANQAKAARNDVVVTDEGRVGVGIDAPRSLLNVVADNVGDAINNVELEVYTQTNSIPSFVTSTYHGTKLSPLFVSANQIIGNFATRAYDGSQLKYASSISTIAENDFNVSSKSSMFFSLNDGGSNTPKERMVIKSNGNVGIGTKVPSERLEVYGGSVLIKTGTSSGGTPSLTLLRDTQIGNDPAAGRITVAHEPNINPYEGKLVFQPRLYNTASNEYDYQTEMVVGHNVGIGTTNPGAKLDIQSSTTQALNIGNGTKTNLNILNDGRIVHGYSDLTQAGNLINLHTESPGDPAGISMSVPDFPAGDKSARMTLYAGNAAGRIANDKNFYLFLDSDNNSNDTNTFSIYKNSSSVSSSAVEIFSFVEDGKAFKAGSAVWTVFSDKRSKENVVNYTKGLKELLQVRPVNFRYKKEFAVANKTYTGVIAQELEKVVPSMVSEMKRGSVKDFKTVDSNEFTYMLINAVKELKKQSDIQQKEIEKLKAQNKEIEELKALVKQLLNK